MHSSLWNVWATFRKLHIHYLWDCFANTSMPWFTDYRKHVYSDHAYNEITLITKHLRIPGKHSLLYFFVNFTLTAKSHITKSCLYNEVILKPLCIKDHSIWHVYSKLVKSFHFQLWKMLINCILKRIGNQSTLNKLCWIKLYWYVYLKNLFFYTIYTVFWKSWNKQ